MYPIYLSSLISLYAQMARAVNGPGRQKNDNDFIPSGGVGIVFANSISGKLYTEPPIRQVFDDCVLDDGDEYTGHL
jgi:hypothetical protein